MWTESGLVTLSAPIRGDLPERSPFGLQDRLDASKAKSSASSPSTLEEHKKKGPLRREALICYRRKQVVQNSKRRAILATRSVNGVVEVIDMKPPLFTLLLKLLNFGVFVAL